jgi:hypothetical protein
MKKYLMVEIAEITEAQKVERQLYALYEDEVRRIYFENDEWLDCETACSVYEAPKFYLPDGLPDPSAAVEVFETQIERFYLGGNNDYELGIAHPFESTPPEGTKLGVFKL